MYDPKSTTLIVSGVIVSGYASGTFIKVKRNKEIFTQKVGAHGDVVDVRSADRTGQITITLLAQSNTNDAFSLLLQIDEKAPYGSKSLPLILKDMNGTTIIGGLGRIKGWPDLDFMEDEPTREWTFLVSDMQYFVGGHA